MSDRSNYSVILHSLQSAVNIGRIMRTAEVFQINIGIYDPTHVLEDSEKRKTVSDFACGALDRTKLLDIGDLRDMENVRRLRKRGRLVATCIGQKAFELPDFVFQEGDMVAIGNEYDGLPADFIAEADEKLLVPMPEVWAPKPKSFSPIDPSRVKEVAQNGLASLSASTSADIIAYSIYLQARHRKP